jgi:steroid 5-alpha reductase family enzyme
MIVQGFVVVLLVMFLSWISYLIRRNAGVFDVAYAFSFFVMGVICFTLGQGYFLRKLFIFFLVSIWSLRLTGYLFLRYARKSQEGRFQAIRAHYKAVSDVQFGLLFLAQGVLVVLLSIPFMLISINPTPHISVLEWCAMLLWIVALCGEIVADKELFQFKHDPKRVNQVCTEGLWRYSRHPNYFFEWLLWVAYFLLALSAPFGLLAIISPILMYYLLVHVTGVQVAEEQALITKGEAYRKYMNTTSRFFPWFPQ